MTDMGNYIAAAAMAADTVDILPAAPQPSAEIRKPVKNSPTSACCAACEKKVQT